MRKLILSTVCTMALGSVSAVADEGSWYTGIEGSYSILGEEKARGTVLDVQSKFKDGWALGGTLGYDFGAWRLEGEIGKHFHNANRFDVVNDGGLGLGGVGSFAATSGASRLTHYMINAVYDFGSFSQENKIEPFVGGGVGLGDLNVKDLATAGAGLAHDSDSVFAYQLFAGIRVPLANAFEMSFKYRFLGTADANLKDRLGNRFQASYGAHDLMVGLTYRFGGAVKKAAADMPKPVQVAIVEPAPTPIVETVTVPDPMPEPAAGPSEPQAEELVIDKGPYVIYFNWDSDDVSRDARAIIAKVAQEAKKIQEIEIRVMGHADRSGPAAYNDNLSRNRAENVKQALIAEGIEAGVISVTSFGEMSAEVETEDGMREPKNRRVLITLK